MLYTVVMDYRGGTYISQVDAGNLAGALETWADTLDQRSIEELGPRRKAELTDDIRVQLSSGQEPALLDGLVNVWCAAASTSGGLALINVVATVNKRAAGTRPIRTGQQDGVT